MFLLSMAIFLLSTASYGSGFVELCSSEDLPAQTENTFRALRAETSTEGCQELFDELKARTELVLVNQELTDLTPLQYLSHLEYLGIAEGYVESVSCGNFRPSQQVDLTPLKSLSVLEELHLQNMAISNEQLHLFKSLPKLNHLWLSCNNITSIEPLLGIENLYTLAIKHNEVASIAGISRLKNLFHFSARNNQLGDVMELGAIEGLAYVDISYNNIKTLPHLPSAYTLSAEHNLLTDESIPSGYRSLVQVFLGKNRLTKVPDIGYRGAMRFINLNDNKISSLDGIEDMTAISSINLNNNPLSDAEIAKIDGSKLTTLEASNTGITKMPDFSRYANLQQLDVSRNDIREVRESELPEHLIDLDVSHNRLETVSFPSRYMAMSLDVSYNSIRSITFNCGSAGMNALNVSGNFLGDSGLNMVDCPSLNYFTARKAGLEDVSFLAKFKTLRWINISQNPVKDISPLKELTLIEKIDFSDMHLGKTVSKSAENCPQDASSKVISAWCSL